MHRRATRPSALTSLTLCLAAGLLAIAAVPAGCNKQARTKAPQAADAAEVRPTGKRKAADRPEAEAAAAPTEKSHFDAAAMDLQGLFDQLNQHEPVAVADAEDGLPRSALGDAPTPPTRATSGGLEPGVALDAIPGEPAPMQPQAEPEAAMGMVVATTTVVSSEPSPPQPQPEGFEEPVAAPAPLSPPPPPANPQDARDIASLGGALTAERPGAATAPVVKPTSVRIGTVALCQRVESYGRYTPLPSNKFIAGRPALMIVYTELSDFSQREELVSEGGDQTHHVVEVSQQIDLLFDADGSRQFGTPEQPVRDISRTSRRDFFIVQRLELPRNLSVGNYNLKLTVRDHGAAGAGAVAEKIVPIVIVADPTTRTAAESGIITPESFKKPEPFPTTRKTKGR